MINGRWRVVALAGVCAGALAALMVPGCGSSDSSKKVPTKFQPDGGDAAGEAGASSGGKGGAGGSAGSAAVKGEAGEGGASDEGGASGASEGGAGGEATGLSGCALGDACCANNQCEDGLNCLGKVCSCVASVSDQYLLRADGVAFLTVQNDTAQNVIVNADTGMPLHGVVGIMGSIYHGCAALDTGEARCWDLSADTNSQGQLGNGPASATYPALNAVLVKTDATTTLSDVVSVGSKSDPYSASLDACAATKSGSAYCWGAGGAGIVGTTTANTFYATQILTAPAGAPLASVTQVTVGKDHACALTAGKVRCWGTNDGTGVTHTYPDAAAEVKGIVGNVLQVSAGFWYSCVLTDDQGGSVFCWGANGGNQLGQGAGASSSSATAVRVKTAASAYLDNVVDLQVAYGGACVVRADHTVWCWGGADASGFATQRKMNNVLISDAVSVSTAAAPDDPRYISTSGVYWIQNKMIAPNCGLE